MALRRCALIYPPRCPSEKMKTTKFILLLSPRIAKRCLYFHARGSEGVYRRTSTQPLVYIALLQLYHLRFSRRNIILQTLHTEYPAHLATGTLSQVLLTGTKSVFSPHQHVSVALQISGQALQTWDVAAKKVLDLKPRVRQNLLSSKPGA